jgi:homoserine O-acetyltransferase
MGLALNHLQRLAIINDPAWRGGDYEPHTQPVAGLALARGIAMCSYKSAELFEERFARRPNRSGEVPGRSLGERFDVAGYLDHQGEALIKRFDANSYLALSKAMDLFDLGIGYDSEHEALARITAKTHLVGISSDWLFPASDVKALAERMGAAGVPVQYSQIETSHGHDGFLAEPDSVVPVIRAVLATGWAACGD